MLRSNAISVFSSPKQFEQAMNKLRSSFIKFDALAEALTKGEEDERSTAE